MGSWSTGERQYRPQDYDMERLEYSPGEFAYTIAPTRTNVDKCLEGLDGRQKDVVEKRVAELLETAVVDSLAGGKPKIISVDITDGRLQLTLHFTGKNPMLDRAVRVEENIESAAVKFATENTARIATQRITSILDESASDGEIARHLREYDIQISSH